MDLSRFHDARVVIIEGVPGAGKTTLQERWRRLAKEHPVSVYDEEALLFGWVHAWLPDIDALRMSLMHRMVEHMERSLAKTPDITFVLNRFHISYLVFSKTPDMPEYHRLIERLRELPVVVLVPQIPPAAMANRVVHIERRDPLWQLHLNKRLETSGFQDITTMYTLEQERVRELLAAQQLKYEILEPIEPEQGRIFRA